MQKQSSVDYGSPEVKRIEKSIQQYCFWFGELEFKSNSIEDQAAALLTQTLRLRREFRMYAEDLFNDQEVRCFVMAHAVFRSGYLWDGTRTQPDGFERLMARLLEPRPGDEDWFISDGGPGLEKVLGKGWETRFELAPRCIFVDGLTIDFDIHRLNEWGKPDDLMKIAGLDDVWPEDETIERVRYMTEVLAKVVVIDC